MHKVIRIIVYGDDEKEARDKAEKILNENLVPSPFDYGTFFDEDGSSVSGKARWGNIPAVCLADSKEGKKLIKEGMKFTKDDFLEKVKQIRKMVTDFSDEELFAKEILDDRKKMLNELDERDTSMETPYWFSYYCYDLSGSNKWLYDGDGETIENEECLKDVLSKWEESYEKQGKQNPNKNKKVFVIPVDVHY